MVGGKKDSRRQGFANLLVGLALGVCAVIGFDQFSVFAEEQVLSLVPHAQEAGVFELICEGQDEDCLEIAEQLLAYVPDLEAQSYVLGAGSVVLAVSLVGRLLSQWLSRIGASHVMKVGFSVIGVGVVAGWIYAQRMEAFIGQELLLRQGFSRSSASAASSLEATDQGTYSQSPEPRDAPPHVVYRRGRDGKEETSRRSQYQPKNRYAVREEPELMIYIDGHCTGKSGRGGWAVLLLHPKSGQERLLSGSYAFTSADRMELMAAIHALQELYRKGVRVEIYSERSYACRAFHMGWIDRWEVNGWKTKSESSVRNRDLWKKLRDLAEEHHVGFYQLMSHSQVSAIEYVAREAREALRFDRHYERDEVYEDLYGLSLSDDYHRRR